MSRRRMAFQQSVRAASSYRLRAIASPAAGSAPCGVEVIQAGAGRERTAARPSASETEPSRTPAQNAASLRPASRLSMLSGVLRTQNTRSWPSTDLP